MLCENINTLRKPEGNCFSILFSGDFCVRSEKTLELIEKGDAPEIVGDVKKVFDNSDIRVLQWETVCGLEGEPIIKSGPNLHNPEWCVDFALSLGVDIALLANNHTGDFGPDMILKTIERLEANNLKTVGAGKNLKDACEFLLIEQNGITIAILNYCENEFGTAKADLPGTAPYNVVNIANALKKAKNAADIVILTLHGGHEQNPLPSLRMRDEFRFFASCGADIVFNCHTHCMEGIEVVNGTPIIYSPGNFFFPKDMLVGGNEKRDIVWRTGYMPKFYCDKSGVYAFEIIPYRFNCEKISLLTGKQYSDCIKYVNKISKIISDDAALKRYFDGWCFANGLHGYFHALRKELPDFEKKNGDYADIIAGYCDMRNLFTCESHNDLIKNSLRIIEENRIEEAEIAAGEVEKLKELDF